MTGAGMLVAIDVPGVVLVVSVLVLLASTALLSRTLPSLDWRRWRRSRSARVRSSGPRVVTGRPPALPAGPVPAAVARRRLVPARQRGPGQDGPRSDARVSEAEAMIEHLLDTDPDQLAWLMMYWIRDDRRRDATG